MHFSSRLLIMTVMGGHLVAQLTAKLILNRIEEAYVNHDINNAVDDFLLKNEADLANVTISPASDCPGAKEKIYTYSVWIKDPKNKNELKEDFVSFSLLQDEPEFILRITNALMQWIRSDVYVRPVLNCVESDHPYLLKVLREKILKPPSDLPYNFTQKNVRLHGQYSQPLYLDMVIFKKKVENGFFIEAGADDFETDSNTLYFEMKRGWSGILVEPNPVIYPYGFMKQRKAWGAPVCLGMEKHPHNAQFAQKTTYGGMAGLVPDDREDAYTMQCFPLYSLILATGNRTINYLSLDIEGAELQVLKTIPWDKVDIEVISVETNHAGEVFPGTDDDIRSYIISNGYVLTHTLGVDDFFVRKDLYDGPYKPTEKHYKRFLRKLELEEQCKATSGKELLYKAFLEALRADKSFQNK